jgi:hypothetical protein
MEHDHPLDIGALPRRTWCRQDFANAHASHVFSEVIVKDRIAVAQQVARELGKGKCLAQLLSGPICGRVGGHIEARRYRASKLARRESIPATVRELTDAQALELQVESSVVRNSLLCWAWLGTSFTRKRCDQILFCHQRKPISDYYRARLCARAASWFWPSDCTPRMRQFSMAQVEPITLPSEVIPCSSCSRIDLL